MRQRTIIGVLLIAVGLASSVAYVTAASQGSPATSTPATPSSRGAPISDAQRDAAMRTYTAQQAAYCPQLQGSEKDFEQYTPVFTLGDAFAQADVVVRVMVERVLPTRPVTDTIDPLSGQSAASPYTDSQVRVLATYKGTTTPTFLVTQFGAWRTLPDTKQREQRFEFYNPIFEPATEHVLFLQRLSSKDRVAGGKEYYYVLRGAGRYEVSGSAVCRFARGAPDGYVPPSTLADLEARLRNGDPISAQVVNAVQPPVPTAIAAPPASAVQNAVAAPYPAPQQWMAPDTAYPAPHK